MRTVSSSSSARCCRLTVSSESAGRWRRRVGVTRRYRLAVVSVRSRYPASDAALCGGCCLLAPYVSERACLSDSHLSASLPGLVPELRSHWPPARTRRLLRRRVRCVRASLSSDPVRARSPTSSRSRIRASCTTPPGALPGFASYRPFNLPDGYSQVILADEVTDFSPVAGTGALNPDMMTLNETGPHAGRYMYRTHEVGSNGAVTVTDLTPSAAWSRVRSGDRYQRASPRDRRALSRRPALRHAGEPVRHFRIDAWRERIRRHLQVRTRYEG
jgi:hypothetical protein